MTIKEEIEIAISVHRLNRLHLEVEAFKQKHPEAKAAFRMTFGSLLNAYREGDISFDGCVAAMNKIAETPKGTTMENETIHVTRISDNDVYGHPTTRCDPAGCAGGNEIYYSEADAEDIEVGHTYTLDENGTVTGEVVE